MNMSLIKHFIQIFIVCGSGYLHRSLFKGPVNESCTHSPKLYIWICIHLVTVLYIHVNIARNVVEKPTKVNGKFYFFS